MELLVDRNICYHGDFNLLYVVDTNSIGGILLWWPWKVSGYFWDGGYK